MCDLGFYLRVLVFFSYRKIWKLNFGIWKLNFEFESLFLLELNQQMFGNNWKSFENKKFRISLQTGIVIGQENVIWEEHVF